VSLTSSATGLANQPVVLTLGGQRYQATTGDNGRANFAVPLGQRPGVYGLAASFAGTSSFQASATAGIFTITRAETTLTLATTADSSRATLKDEFGRPLSGKSVYLVVNGEGETHRHSATTNFEGVALFTALPAAAGTYGGTAYFGATSRSPTVRPQS